MNIPPLVKLLIAAAWQGLAALLMSVGVPAVVIDAIRQVLVHFGILGGIAVSKEQMISRATKVMAQVSENH